MFRIEGKSITLDLNGKTISVNHQAASMSKRLYAVVYVAGGAGLTVTGNGHIEMDAHDKTPASLTCSESAAPPVI